MSVKTEWVDLTVDDGTTMRAYVARPDGAAPKRGLLVFQEAFGVNGHIRDVTERFAAMGFLALSPELFHRTAPPGFETGYTDFSVVMPHFGAITEPNLDADVRAAYGWLRRAGVGDHCASVGWCLGGRVSFLANTALPLKAQVSYYGGYIPPHLGRAPKMSGPALFYWGGLDQHIGADQREAVHAAVSEAKKPFVEVLFSNADHGFFCDARGAYQKEAAQQSWALTNAFLDSYCPR